MTALRLRSSGQLLCVILLFGSIGLQLEPKPMYCQRRVCYSGSFIVLVDSKYVYLVINTNLDEERRRVRRRGFQLPG